MSHNALYFPYINLPRDAWSTKALLYWDGISSIVPMDHLRQPDQMSEFMRGLLSEGLVKPLSPSNFLREIPGFSEVFVDYIQSRLERSQFVSGRERNTKTIRIHAEKLDCVTDYLVDVGLAERVSWGWYDVRSDIAQQFMFYLATCLGALKELEAVPVTNSLLNISRIAPRMNRPSNLAHRHKAREVVLQQLLPAPAETLTVDQIVVFKRRYGHLLPRLRSHVEQHCIRTASLLDPADRIELNRLFIEECEDQLDEIKAAMKPSFGKLIFGSLVPLLGVGFAYPPDGGMAAYAGGALGVISAAYQAISTIQETQRYSEQVPLAYVAHARRVLE